jgi:hypothetical protein
MSRLGLAVTKQSQIDRVWDVIDKVGVCMMSTRFSGGLRARPLEARADKEEGLIWLLSDRRGVKDDENSGRGGRRGRALFCRTTRRVCATG